MIYYVCAFIFNEDESKVLLIEKTKPPVLKDMWNGIGGKIESGESSADAIVREVKEECGIEPANFDDYLTLQDAAFLWHVRFYRTTVLDTMFFRAAQLEEEVIGHCGIYNLNRMPVVPNLHWLIPLALDRTLDYHRIVTEDAT